MMSAQRQGDWLFYTRPRTQTTGEQPQAHIGGQLLSESEVSGHAHVCTMGAASILSPTQVVIRPDDGRVAVGHVDASGQMCGHDTVSWIGIPDDSEVVGIRQIQVAPDGLVEVSPD